MPERDPNAIRADGSALAGGLLAASLMDVLVDKGILNIDDARQIVEIALKALAPDIKSPEGFAAAQALTGMMSGKYSKRVPSK